VRNASIVATVFDIHHLRHSLLVADHDKNEYRIKLGKQIRILSVCHLHAERQLLHVLCRAKQSHVLY
jgi:hypothetical protein